VNGNQAFGQLLMLQSDAASTDPEAGLRGGAYFSQGGFCYLDVIAATNASSGEVSIRVSPTDGSTPTFFAPLVATFTTNMGLENAQAGMRRARVGPLPLAGRARLQVEIAATDAGKFTDLIAARFVSSTNSRGMTVSTASAGGYRVDSFLTQHAESGPLVAAMDPNVVFLSLGANDIGISVTPEQHKASVRSLIEWLRFWIDADLPIVLLSDPARTQISPSQQSLFDRYPGAHYELAQEMHGVCSVNSRLLTEREGWTVSTVPLFCRDQVHYNTRGASTKARVEIEALMRAFTPTRMEISALMPGGTSRGQTIVMRALIGQPMASVSWGTSLRMEAGLPPLIDLPTCAVDVNGDGFIDFFDYDAYVECYETEVCPPGRNADMNGDGFVDFFDYDEFVLQYEIGC
jgi:lysophospholipase L1-like esterase